MKRCMLIGGAGFIGQNLARALKASYDITIVDRIDCIDSLLADIKYLKRDFFENGLEDELFKDVDCVVLLACTVGPKSSMENPELCYKTDIVCLNRLLEQMHKNNCRQLIFISSGGTVYGEHEEKLLNEKMDNFPINHYGIMKLTQEKIILMYNRIYGMNNVIFRLSNPYGSGQKMSSGIGAVTAILNNVMNNDKIHIWGDGRVVRDYIYINDAVDMIKSFLDKSEKLPYTNAVYNVGTGVGTSLNELITIVEEVTGRKADVDYEAPRAEDVSSNILDNSKIKSIIGDYRCISVREGVEKYYRLYHKE